VLFTVLILLFFSPPLLLAMSWMRMRWGYIWLAAALCAGLGWVALFVTAWRLPVSLDWQGWGAGLAAGGSRWLLVDAYSWPPGFLLAAIGLGAILTGLAQPEGNDWQNLASILGVLAVGLFGVFAGGLAALGFAWTAMDILELVILLRRSTGREARERVMLAFGVNIGATILVILGLVASRGGLLSFQPMPQEAGLVLVLAAGFRLGVLPVQAPYSPSLRISPALETMMRLAPVAGSLSLLARASAVGLPDFWRIPLLVFVWLAGFYGAVNWLTREDDPAGPQYWILGIASLAVAAAVWQASVAVSAWGVILLAGGSLAALRRSQSRGFRLFFGMAMAGMAGLPFTPGWAAVMGLGAGPWWGGWLFGGLVVVILLGFYRRTVHDVEGGDGLAGGSVCFTWLVCC